jgi:hypothetical protein
MLRQRQEAHLEVPAEGAAAATAAAAAATPVCEPAAAASLRLPVFQ